MLKPFFILAFTANNLIFTTYADNHPEEKCKGDNEIFVKCPDTVCVPKTCDEVGYPLPCDNLHPGGKCPSKPGCICKENYVRDKHGKCIPIKDCPSCGGDPNAVSGCGVNCERHCADYLGHPIPCEKICHKNSCDCRKGYYYDDRIKKCVKPKECKKCYGPNEEFVKTGICDKSCPKKHDGKNHDKIGKQICKNQCLCKKGYVRALNNTCIRIIDCKEPQCPIHEKYEKNPTCKPRKCSELGFKIKCDDKKPGCVCIDDYVRNNKGVCIPKKECPSCGGDPNAVAGCGLNCNKHCSDIGKKPGPCNTQCHDNACDCRDGFFYDDSTKKCVKPEECKICTKPHEVYDKCPPTCPPQTCESIGKSITVHQKHTNRRASPGVYVKRATIEIKLESVSRKRTV
uniref:Protease inhibitor 3 n=1 Tax=Lonomia obliqua TaxID=304329 RepID=Q5MGH5_LONON|nr:protease inhibitor 3 [Lonomia obliqua]